MLCIRSARQSQRYRVSKHLLDSCGIGIKGLFIGKYLVNKNPVGDNISCVILQIAESDLVICAVSKGLTICIGSDNGGAVKRQACSECVIGFIRCAVEQIYLSFIKCDLVFSVELIVFLDRLICYLFSDYLGDIRCKSLGVCYSAEIMIGGGACIQ